MSKYYNKDGYMNHEAFEKEFDVLEETCLKADKYDEKETPKKPIERKEKDIIVGDYTAYDCPNCKQEQVMIFPNGDIVGVKHKYCSECATALDWSKK